MITDTIFQGNWRSYNPGDTVIDGSIDVQDTILILERCQFISNQGSAIRAVNSHLDVHNSTFAKNIAQRSRSIIFLQFSTLYVASCHCINNSVETNGIISALGFNIKYLRLQHLQHGQLRTPHLFYNSTFQGNRAKGNGGALYIEIAEIEINGCSFINNSASSGGAFYIKSGSQRIFIILSTFTFNEVKSDGGAIYCNDNGAITIYESHLASNSAINGGFAYLSNCRLTVHSTFSSNKASKGGAIYATNSDITFLNKTTMVNNIAREYGGALYLVVSKLRALSILHNVVLSAVMQHFSYADSSTRRLL